MVKAGGALRQCVYQLKYRHLLLRNCVFFGGVGECVFARRTHTQKQRRAVATKLIRLFELWCRTGYLMRMHGL